MNRLEAVYLLFIILLLLDFLIVKYLYRLVYGFLIGQTNKKNAAKIHEEQNVINQITLQYIEGKLKKGKKEFRINQKIYFMQLSVLIPQYITLIVMCILSVKLAQITLQILCVIKIIEFLIVRLQFDGNRVPYSASK